MIRDNIPNGMLRGNPLNILQAFSLAPLKWFSPEKHKPTTLTPAKIPLARWHVKNSVGSNKKRRPRAGPPFSYVLQLRLRTISQLGQVYSLPQRRVGRGQTGDGDPEGRTGDIVEPDLVAENDRRGIAAVLAADAELDLGPVTFNFLGRPLCCLVVLFFKICRRRSHREPSLSFFVPNGFLLVLSSPQKLEARLLFDQLNIPAGWDIARSRRLEGYSRSGGRTGAVAHKVECGVQAGLAD